MSYDLGTATKQATALLDAAKASPVRQFRYELRRRGLEWSHAAKMLDGAAEDEDVQVVIELAGSVTPGMKIPLSAGTGTIVRSMNRDGQFSLHIEDPDGRPLYFNYAGPSSPVAVFA